MGHKPANSYAPYSVSVDPSGRFVYAASVAGNVHYSFEMNPTSGALTPLANGAVIVSRDQPISLITYNSPTSPAAATFSSRFAYAANSGDNTLSGYAINAATGALTATTPTPSAGNGPRAIAVHPRNRFVIGVNHTNQNDLASYAINSPGGALSSASSTIWTGGRPSRSHFTQTVDPFISRTRSAQARIPSASAPSA